MPRNRILPFGRRYSLDLIEILRNRSNDSIVTQSKISFRNVSIMDVMSPINSTRGNRATAGILDEYRDHSADDINEIILPLLNVDRPMVN